MQPMTLLMPNGFELSEIKNLGLWEKTVEIINKADMIRKSLVP